MWLVCMQWSSPVFLSYVSPGHLIFSEPSSVCHNELQKLASGDNSDGQLAIYSNINSRDLLLACIRQVGHIFCARFLQMPFGSITKEILYRSCIFRMLPSEASTVYYLQCLVKVWTCRKSSRIICSETHSHTSLCLCKLKFSVDFLLMKYYDDMSIQSIEFQ